MYIGIGLGTALTEADFVFISVYPPPLCSRNKQQTAGLWDG